MKLPFVFINMSMTADGKIATTNRSVSTFSSRRDFTHLLELRARADAVMSGATTVDQKGVDLGPGPARFRSLRLRGGRAEYNLRIVASGSGSIDPRAEIFRHRFSPVIVLTSQAISRKNLGRLRAVADEVRVCGKNGIDFRRAFEWLRDKWKVRRLLCEGGGELNGALFRAGLVDELHLTICPKIIGGRDAPTIAGGTGALTLADATRLILKSSRKFGDELFLVYKTRPTNR